MQKQTILKSVSLISVIITMALVVNLELLTDELIKYFWPLHIVAMVLGFIMIFGLIKDHSSLVKLFDPFLPKSPFIKFLAKGFIAVIVQLILLLTIMSPMIYSFSTLPIFAPESTPFKEGAIFQGFILIWLLFFSMEFLYFWLVKSLTEHLVEKYS
ncbi:hypothetical protein [Paraglaciecola sp. 2405UD69-4]|uniref:hypothetical protein n=1 Tax=Paraglaciecola sp. 2405UD69-4 TaxID=3391836 RepID=UPI0039C94552